MAGGGRDLRTYRGAYNLKNNYANDVDMEIVDVSTTDIAPTENDMLGYSDILNGLDDVNYVLREKSPENIFLIGGSCESSISCIAWLNKRYAGNMAIVYIDAHGDLNTPQASDSKLFYGMGLRALTGESSNVVGLGILEYIGDENDKSNKLLKRLVQYGKEQV